MKDNDNGQNNTKFAYKQTRQIAFQESTVKQNDILHKVFRKQRNP